MLDPFQLEFVQRGVLEVLLLSGAAGLLGTWIVMRGLSFYAHAVGTAAFPGLVLADGLGFSAPLGAFAAALVFAFGVERLARRPRAGYDSLTALVLVAALAGGVVLASDVFESGGNVDSLLFGSLLLTGTRDLVLAGAASTAAVVATFALGPRWLARGFDPAAARAMGLRSQWPDALLLVLIAFAVVASLTAIGALLATALFVVPAATVRLWTQRLPVWQLGSVALTAAQGIAGLWLSVELNTPPGPTVAVLGGALFAASLVWHRIAVAVRGRVALVGTAVMLALVLSACGGSASKNSGPDVVASTTQIGDWARAVGGDAVHVHQILQPNTDPHEYEPRPADVQAVADSKLVFESGDELDAWMDTVISNAGGSPHVIDLGAKVPVRLRATARVPRLALRPALVARPAQRRGGHRGHPHGARRRRSRARVDLPQARCNLHRPAAGAGRRHSRLSRERPVGAAQARLRPRRVQLLRAPLRHHRDRRGDPVADDAGAGLGRRHRRSRARRAPRARARDLPRELAQPETGRADRARDGRAGGLHALRRHARPERLARRDVPLDGGSERRRHGARLHRGRPRVFDRGGG